MIAALLTRLGIPAWRAVMLACALAAGTALIWRAHLIDQGMALEAARRDQADAANAQRARDALAQANARTAAAQARLDAAIAELSALHKEFSDEQSNSAALQSELAAGRRRLSVLTRARAPDPAGPGQGAAAAGVDPGTALAADLDGRVASDLEWARQTRNEAIRRLDACIAAYDAVARARSE